ncbi:MAG: prepilin-type N-terminal cleavage/methylation domain-containing protein [Rhodobiaceae bacterium]|nr:prepilin-type N-terminal cleavage/methylation domain-containing protein [Hyphomonas sp.]MCB9970032.1 prepilin-type N-terminal cleavage/methylation domain-containing protein [Hyphomonas sp.]MCC0050333.1 prepilin-type N-terminal cleavage/methylation domain-containing protein [Rhodobiaceae bacterium]
MQPERPSDSGFSLIEVLVALAITSVIAMLVFSSLTGQLRQADAVRSSTEKLFQNESARRLLDAIVSQTVPAWADEPDKAFQGTPQEVYAVAAVSLFETTPKLQKYSLSLTNRGLSSVLTVRTDEGSWEMGGISENAEFRFLGNDGAWYANWPLKAPVNASLTDLERYFANQGLPRMICVWNTQGDHVEGYEVALEDSQVLPARIRDVAGPTP